MKWILLALCIVPNIVLSNQLNDWSNQNNDLSFLDNTRAGHIEHAPKNIDPFTGFIIGAGGGVALDQTIVRSNSTSTTQTGAAPRFNMTPVDALYKVPMTRGLGTVFFGYGYQFAHRFYIGAVVTGTFIHHQWQVNDFRYDENIATSGLNENIRYNTIISLNKAEAAIDLTPGIALNSDTLLYFRVGAAFNKIRLNGAETASDSSGAAPLEGAALTFSRTIGATSFLRLGAGVQYNLLSNLSLRFDYIYTNYGSISSGTITALMANGVDPTELLVHQTRVKYLTSNMFTLGLLYTFNF